MEAMSIIDHRDAEIRALQDKCVEFFDEIESLRAQVEALKADSERYHYCRDVDTELLGALTFDDGEGALSTTAIDARVDEVMAADDAYQLSKAMGAT
jgi:hypothetical protein